MCISDISNIIFLLWQLISGIWEMVFIAFILHSSLLVDQRNVSKDKVSQDESHDLHYGEVSSLQETILHVTDY